MRFSFQVWNVNDALHVVRSYPPIGSLVHQHHPFELEKVSTLWVPLLAMGSETFVKKTPASLIDNNTCIIVFTDLEPDDRLAIRIGLKGIALRGIHPDVSFVVGEGYAPLQRKAKLEQLLLDEASLHHRPDFAHLPVHMGSSSRRRIGLTHAIFGARAFGTNAHVEVTNHAAAEQVTAAKRAGKRVVIMELKPVNDSYELLRRCGHLLTEDDFVLFSGSYNFREADVTIGQLQQLLNHGGRYQRALFESWPSLRQGGFPGELSTLLLSTQTSSVGQNLARLRAQMLDDTSAPSVDHEATVSDWNIAVSADCIYSAAEIMWDAGIGTRAIVRKVGEDIIDLYPTALTSVDQLNSRNMNRLMNAVLGSGSKDDLDNRSPELMMVLEKRLVNAQFESFKRNWTVAESIRRDRAQMLIGDAVLFAYLRLTPVSCARRWAQSTSTTPIGTPHLHRSGRARATRVSI